MEQASNKRRAGIGLTLLIAFGTMALLPLGAALVGGIGQQAVRAPIEALESTSVQFISSYRELTSAVIEIERLVFSATARSTDGTAAAVADSIRGALARTRALLGTPESGLSDGQQYQQLLDAFALIEQKSLDIAAKVDLRAATDAAIAERLKQIETHADNVERFTRERAALPTDGQVGARAADSLANLRFLSTTLSQVANQAVSSMQRSAAMGAQTRYAASLRDATFQLSLLSPRPENAKMASSLDSLFTLGRGPGNLFALQQGRIGAEEEVRVTYAQVRDDVRTFLQVIDDFVVASSDRTRIELEAAAGALESSALALVIAVAASAGIAIWVSRRYVFLSLVARLRQLTNSTKRLSSGDLEEEIAVDGNDEITDLQQALIVFRANARHLQERDRALAMRTGALEQANRELDNFAYVASHDLRAPLRAIDVLATFVIEDIGDNLPDESTKHLQLMKKRIARLDSLLVSLLEYSRIGRKELAFEQVDLSAVVKTSVDLVVADGFDVSLSGDFPRVKTAKSPVAQVVRNLIDNAIKHHDCEHGQIEVRGQLEGDEFKLTVSDDGPGIDPEYHERIFGLFQTLKSRDEVEGSGMGLSMLRKTLEQLGGSIDLSSFPEQRRGSTFVARWPVQVA